MRNFLLLTPLIVVLFSCDNFVVPFTNVDIVLYSLGLQAGGGNLGGQAGADALCQATIPAAISHKSSRAFISSSSTYEIRDMLSNFAIPSNLPVRSLIGVTLADNFAGLLDGTIDTTLATANVITNGNGWFSGSTSAGVVQPANCTDWTSSSALGSWLGGLPTVTDSTWISNSVTAGCDIATNNLLCLAFTPVSAPNTIIMFNAGQQAGGGNLGGRSGADALCVTAKPSTVTQSNVRAFLSVSASDEIRDMPIIYNVPTDLNVRSSSGSTIASNWSDLLDGTIDLTLAAAGIVSNGSNWISGSDSAGVISGVGSCTGFTSSSLLLPGSSAGTPIDTDSNWITGIAFSCAAVNFNLLCIAF